MSAAIASAATASAEPASAQPTSSQPGAVWKWEPVALDAGPSGRLAGAAGFLRAGMGGMGAGSVSGLGRDEEYETTN